MSTDISFVLLAKAASPEPDAVIAAAAKLGLALTYAGNEADVQQYDLDAGRTLFVMTIDAPHPDVPTMMFGPTAVPEDEARAATAHMILTAMGLEGTPRERDTQLAALTAAVIDNVPAVGAMLGHGAIFHKAKLFSGLAALGIEQAAIKGKGALDFVMGLVRWMLNDPSKQLPTGETVGRSPDEKITIHRVKSPEGEEHIRLDLPDR